MKLLNSLYTIEHTEPSAKGQRFDLSLDAEHFIYKAHFPEQPITPGVCIVQIALELLEEHLQSAFTLKTVKNVKFLSVISPADVKHISYDLQNIREEDGMVKAQVVVTSADTTFAKISFGCKRP